MIKVLLAIAGMILVGPVVVAIWGGLWLGWLVVVK